MTFASYPNNDQLYGTMISFGEYQLSYVPPEKGIEGRITMSISAEANIDQMLEIFLNFLRASGYCISPYATLELNEDATQSPEQTDAQKLEGLWTANQYIPPVNVQNQWYGGYSLGASAGNDTITF